MILVRATRLSSTALELADALAAGSAEEVAFVLDGRHPPAVRTRRTALMLTREACSGLGLFCPPDFAWRCGDYGLYLARARFPGERHFWLLEHDVRLAGGDVAEFFRFFEAQPAVDYLACAYRRASRDWGWYPHACARDVVPYRSLFGVVRLSARALDFLLHVRRAQAQRWARRKRWPNDEAFVATTLSNAGYECKDLNAFGRRLYDEASFSLTRPIRGETFQPDAAAGLRIYHPVLFGEDFARGNVTAAYLKAPPPGALRLRIWLASQALGAVLSTQRWGLDTSLESR